MARCKYGKLKNPVGGRRCKKKPGGKGGRKATGRKRRCKYGKLKNPVGRRVCKKRPRKGRRRR